ncbi:hypothetical protein A2V68_03095 [candidate division Kazan bacterium RBG_13_50_9]|uniref:Protochlamydia outer membrane protein domain-containing protein n=1 Tax=candidate division Kazan bacterium RBG_13_50_9 TaxID=1798535 RepID=A0A1F4NUN0_UNCK3|nr:MAG: hypothetical protein A2V68_03095 [candidate division Kazan bacterium RBG_13_50_9]
MAVVGFSFGSLALSAWAVEPASVETEAAPTSSSDEPSPIQFFGFIHGDAKYPDGGPGATCVDRIRMQWTWQIDDDWSSRLRFDYRDHTESVDLKQGYLAYHGDGWKLAAGRVFIGSVTPTPDQNRFTGYPGLNTGPCETTGLTFDTSWGATDFRLSLVNEDNTFRGRYDDVVVSLATELNSGISLSSLGYLTDTERVWAFDVVVPIGERSHIKYLFGADEKAPKSHGRYLEGSLGLDERWTLNAAYDYGQMGGVAYQVLPISLNYDWGKQGGVPKRVILQWTTDLASHEDVWSLRFQYPLGGGL